MLSKQHLAVQYLTRACVCVTIIGYMYMFVLHFKVFSCIYAMDTSCRMLKFDGTCYYYSSIGTQLLLITCA